MSLSEDAAFPCVQLPKVRSHTRYCLDESHFAVPLANAGEILSNRIAMRETKGRIGKLLCTLPCGAKRNLTIAALFFAASEIVPKAESDFVFPAVDKE